MNATADKTKKQEPFICGFLHFYRKYLMKLLIFCVMILFFVIRMKYVAPTIITRYYDILLESVNQVDCYQQYVSEANDAYVTMRDENFRMEFKLLSKYIEKESNVQQGLVRLNSNSDDKYTCFYLKEDGTIISDPGRKECTLDASELQQLCADGKYYSDTREAEYIASSCGDGYLLARIYTSTPIQYTMEVLNFIPVDGFIYDDESLEILESGEDIIPASLSDMFFSDPLESSLFNDPKVQVYLISPYTKGIAKYTEMRLAVVFRLPDPMEGQSVCAYVRASEILNDFLVSGCLPVLFCMVYIFLCIFGMLRFHRLWNDGKHEEKIISLPFGCHINASMVQHVIFMQACLGLLAIICSVTMQMLNSFDVDYILADYRLNQIIETNDTCQENLERYRSEYIDSAFEMADEINILLTSDHFENYEELRGVLKEATDSEFVKEISIYDQDGNNVCTTSDYIGYPLSQDPDSEEYQFWTLMTGHTGTVIVTSETDSHTIYCASSRSDEVGVVLVTLSDLGFSDLEEKLGPLEVLSNFDFYDSYKVYVEEDNPDMLYVMQEDGSSIGYANSGFPVLEKRETLTCFRSIDGELYFVNGMGGNSNTFYCEDSVSETAHALILSTVNQLFFLLTIGLLNLLGCVFYSVDDISPEEFLKKTKLSPFMNRMRKKAALLGDAAYNSQKILWQAGLFYIMFMVVAILLLDVLLNRISVLEFLLEGTWEKGVSVFSITLALLAGLAVHTISYGMKHFFAQLAKTLPPHSVTVCQMVYSIGNIIMIVWLVLYAAAQFGINTTAVVAGVGISGLVVGISAQDTINDMLNGIFVILDRRIQVGDYVEVDDFYGEVVQIGIRTTKIRDDYQEKSLNNSSLNDVKNLSRGTSKAVLTFTVGLDTDLDRLADIITKSSSRFQEACKDKILGDAEFHNVSEFKDGGIVCMVKIPVEECERKRVTRMCNRILKEILDENGIPLYVPTEIEISR